jgi:magnesium chelatase family protein
MVAHVFTVAPLGFEGAVVEVESDAKKGLPAIQIVGMGTKSVDEAKERVRSAVANSLLEFPAKKITNSISNPHQQRSAKANRGRWGCFRR